MGEHLSFVVPSLDACCQLVLALHHFLFVFRAELYDIRNHIRMLLCHVVLLGRIVSEVVQQRLFVIVTLLISNGGTGVKVSFRICPGEWRIAVDCDRRTWTFADWVRFQKVLDSSPHCP